MKQIKKLIQMAQSYQISALIAFVLLSILNANAQTGTLPLLRIDTRNHQPVTSKTVYIPGTYFIVDNQNPDFNLGSVENPLPLEIKGRGHSSWKGVKKPYKLKLAEKAPLCGMSRNKHWVLLKFNEATVAGMRLGNVMGMDGVILLGFILGFPANETVLPVILMTYLAEGSPVEISDISALKDIFIQNGWTLKTAVCTLMFMLFHFPCATSCMTVKKETGSLKWTAMSFIIPLVTGIILCMIINLIFIII